MQNKNIPYYDTYGCYDKWGCSYGNSCEMNFTLPKPHYSDPYWDQERLVWGSKSNCHAVYSDRLWQWDYKKAERASEIADEKIGKFFTPAWVQAYLSAYFDKPVTLQYVIAGVNRSNGYSYYAYGYSEN